MNAEEGLKLFGSDEEVEAVVRGFESCAVAPEGFRHREHLALALCYLTRADLDTALALVREGLYRFLRHHGKDASAYNETVTLFWLRRVRSLAEARADARTLAETANEVLSSCGESKLIYEYYSRELLASEAARTAWAEPDLRPLDF